MERTIDAKPHIAIGKKFPCPPFLQYMVRLNVPVIHKIKDRPPFPGFEWVRYYGHAN